MGILVCLVRVFLWGFVQLFILKTMWDKLSWFISPGKHNAERN